MTGKPNIVREAATYVKGLLERELPPWMLYHTPRHTQDTVSAAEEIGQAEGLSDSDMEIVRLAGWFHDLGYLQKTEGHEQHSAGLAREFLMSRKYPVEKIEQVVGAILATRVPQKPGNLLERVVADADLSYLGREVFFERSALMRVELEKNRGERFTDADWIRTNIEFVEAHTWHTRYAYERFGPTERENLAVLREELRALTAAGKRRLESAESPGRKR